MQERRLQEDVKEIHKSCKWAAGQFVCRTMSQGFIWGSKGGGGHGGEGGGLNLRLFGGLEILAE